MSEFAKKKFHRFQPSNYAQCMFDGLLSYTFNVSAHIKIIFHLHGTIHSTATTSTSSNAKHSVSVDSFENGKKITKMTTQNEEKRMTKKNREEISFWICEIFYIVVNLNSYCILCANTAIHIRDGWIAFIPKYHSTTNNTRNDIYLLFCLTEQTLLFYCNA